MLSREVVLFCLLAIVNRIDTSCIKHPNTSCNAQQINLADPHTLAGEVQFAIDNKGECIGSGVMGKVYAIKEKILGHDAVLKAIENQGYVYSEAMATREARNTYTVDQLLAWGSREDDEGDSDWYFVMKNMGMSKEKAQSQTAGLTKDEAGVKILNAKAVERYAQQYKMDNKDPNSENFVYRRTEDGTWVAEIVDWQIGEWLGGHEVQPPNALPREILKPVGNIQL